MAELPDKTSFTDTAVTKGGFRAALDQLNDYLSGLLGTDGTAASAREALGVKEVATRDLGAGPDQVPTNDVLLDVFTSKAQYEYDLPLTAIADEPSPLGYKSEPQLVYCADGSILCVYRRGSAHVSNDGRIVAKRSADLGRTWGAEILVHNQEPYDTRNPTVGIDPGSGRLIVFSRTLNATSDRDGIHQAIYYQTSDDSGATWNPATDISPLFADVTADGFTPFGPIVRTVNGLMQLVYAVRTSTNQQWCWALFSTDGGQTWGSRATVYAATQVAGTFVEPVPVRVDDKRIVVLIRDLKGSNKYWYTKSGDGGLTWSSASGASAQWASQTAAGSAPIWGIPLGESEIVVAWASRGEGEPDSGFGSGVGYMTSIATEAFWARPGWAWQTGIEPRRRIAVSRVTSVNAASWSEWGYACLLAIPGIRHTALVAWYDTKDGSNTTETDIWITTLPR